MNPALIRAFLFDLDGVVAFTDRYHELAWRSLAEAEAWEFPHDLAHSLRGISRMDSVERILAHNTLAKSAADKERYAERKNAIYVDAIGKINHADTVPGAIAFIKRAKAEGVRIALCSASRNALTVLEALGIGDLFDTVVTGADIHRSKPDPEIFLLAAERLGIPPFHCLVFEDAVSGVEAAHRGGMKCVGVGTPELLPNAAEVLPDFSAVDLQALLETGRLHRPEPEPWGITQTTLRSGRCNYWESIFALSNGMIGVRGALEETSWPGQAYPATFANGVFGRKPYEHLWKLPGFAEGLEMMLNLADWTRVDLTVDGVLFHPDAAGIANHHRHLDFSRGCLVREFEWCPNATAKVRVRTTRLVSMARRHCAALSYEVEAISDCRVELTASTMIPSEHWHLLGEPIVIQEMCEADGCDLFLLAPADGPNKVALATITRFLGGEPPRRTVSGRVVTHSNAGELQAGEQCRLEKNVAILSTVTCPSEVIRGEAIRLAASDAADGFQKLEQEQSAWWKNWWAQHDILIDGNSADQQAIRFNLFQLRQSFPTHPKLSIGANFLTGDKYCGHVFWDTEMYIAPSALYSEPEIARPLLDYRYHLLDKARKRAREVGNKGALYAWNSISGEECATVFEASTAEYHLVSAVAWAIHRYVQQTGDTEWLWKCGAEILFETARFLEDLGGYVPLRGGQFCINAVCGPDEYACGVNNNCYTNIMAQWHLRYAADVFDRMKVEAPAGFDELCSRCGFSEQDRNAWQRAGDAMFVPFREDLGIHAQDDGFLNLSPVDMSRIPMHTDIREKFHPLLLWRTQVCKQADTVLMLFLHGDQFTREVKEADYDFYEPRTNHGSSLSASIHAIIAAELGRIDEAYQFFHLSACMDINDFKGNVAGGLHSACMGGTWMALVNGFGGMRDYQRGLEFAPRLPHAWNSCTFRVFWRGTLIQVEMRPDRTRYSLLDGGDVTFLHHGEKVHLTGTCPIEISSRRVASAEAYPG
jgi:alpha,alpha-trehalose phosphorylase